MPTLRLLQTYGTFVRSSSFLANQSYPLIARYEIDEGTGVVKRPNWRSLPYPQISSPVAYNKSWKKELMGTQSFHYTENGPGGSYNFWTDQGPLQRGPGFAQNSEIPGCLDESGYKAKVKLFNQLKGEGANIANMLGERKQIVKSLENVLNVLVYTARDLRRGNIVSAVRRMGGDPLTARKLKKVDIASQWLSLQYGWKPLLSDSYDIVNRLHKRESDLLMTFRASSRTEKTAKSDSSWAFDPAYGRNHGIRKTLAIQKYMIRAWPNRTLAEPAALGVTNPLVVAWELTPWSFVVDWFLPIGRYLEQLSAAHGWDFHDGCVSTLVKSDENAAYSVSQNTKSGDWSYSRRWGLAGVSCSYIRFDRSTLGAFPTASVPRFKNPLSLAHFYNATALLSQVIAGRKK